MPEADLRQAQDRLARTLDRARSSEDRELMNRVRDEGFQLVHLLNGVLRMSHLHSLDNRAFDAPVRELARALGRLCELLGALTLISIEDQVYLNEIRIRMDDRGGGGKELGGELAAHGLGGLRVHRGPSEDELRRLVACFARKPPEREPRQVLREALQAQGLDFLEALGPFRFRVGGEGAGPARDPRQALRRAGQAVADAFQGLGQGRLLNPLPARRAVTEMLAAGLEREGLALDPPGLPVHASHALRVARLALLLGRELGLSEAVLQDLGVAALFHDAGYSSRDAQGRPPVFGHHPSQGARLLLRQRGFHLAKIRRLRAVLGHHTPAEVGRRRRPALLARVIRLAEDYDNLVRRARLAPAVALGRMAGAAGSLYDTALLQALVNALGAFQPGTRVTLEDGRGAVVVSPGRGAAAFARPTIVIDRAADGSQLAKPERVDLARSPLRLHDEPPPPLEPGEPGGASPALSQPADDHAHLVLAEPGRAEAHPLALPESTPRASEPLSGDIVQGIPIRLMHDLHREKRSGRLIFDDGGQRRALLFVKGNVVAAASTLAEHRLPALLLRSDLIETEVIEQAQAEALRRVWPLGGLLVEKGVLEGDQLEMLLRAQARLVVSDVATWDEGRYHFEDGDPPGLEEDVSEGLSMPHLVQGAVRAIRDPDVVRFAIGDLGRVLRPCADAEAGARQLLGPAEEAVLEQVDGHTPARLALGASGLPPEDGQRALLALLALGLAEYET